MTAPLTEPRGRCAGSIGKTRAARTCRGRGGRSARCASPSLLAFGAALCALALVLVFSTAPASAALTHPFLSSFGPEGPGKGTFANPQSVATDSEGDVYVYDAGAEEGSIYKFDAAGKPLNFTALGSNVITKVGGKGTDEQELAISSAGPAKGDIFIANGHFVGVYSAAGAKLSELTEPGGGHPWGEPCGVAVDPAGNVYVGLEPSHVNKYTPSSTTVSNANYVSSLWHAQTVCNVAADAAGVYVDTWSEGPVNKFPALTFSETEPLVEEEHAEVDPRSNTPSTLAVNPSTGNVFIDERSDVAQYEGAAPFKRLGSSGIAEPGALHESFGVAADGAGAAERVYVSSTNPTGVVNILGPAVVVPDVTVEEVSNLAGTSVTLNGTINPDNEGNATCRFEYGTSTAYGKVAACAEVPSGATPVAVTAGLTGLEPNTTYHYRLDATNGNGVGFGSDRPFTTTGPPRIESTASEAVTKSTATLTAHVNPDGLATKYHFEYGETTAYGSTTPEGEITSELTSEHEVSAPISGLRIGATYDFRLVATNTAGPTVDGPDGTLTTLSPIAGESVSSLAPTGVTLNASVNPEGSDTHYYFQYGTEDCTKHPAACKDAPEPPGTDLGSSEGAQPASTEVSGLSPETTYHYHVIAISALNGTVEGPDQTFTTYAAVPASGGCPNEQLRAATRSSRLPDCRTYELVSPAVKNGGEAGATAEGARYAVANAAGTAIYYARNVSFGSSTDGLPGAAFARRSSEGWSTTAAYPRALGQLEFKLDDPFIDGPSADLSHAVFSDRAQFVGSPDTLESPNLLRDNGEPFREPEWVSRPTSLSPNPPFGGSRNIAGLLPAGGSPDLNTIYFTYNGTLVPEDASRAENPVFKEDMKSYSEYPYPTGAIWGFYEWRDGALHAAGVLPNGTVHPFGAVPASTGQNDEVIPDDLNNQVSVDGSQAFFVSPDPASKSACQESGYEAAHPGGCVPQLYVRENGERTALVSEDALLSKSGEPPPPASHGPVPVQIPSHTPGAGSVAYVYASPDGSHALFESEDKLAKSAGGQEPTGVGPWTYDFNVKTNSLSYLPGVVGPILAASTDGSRFIFQNTVGGELALFSGGSVTRIAQLPTPEHTNTNFGNVYIAPARATADGAVFVFETDSPLPGGFNNTGGWEQVYRYDVAAGELNCVSCPPHGVAPSGDARLSEDDAQGGNDGNTGLRKYLAGSRGISSDGARVFFDTPSRLVPQDINGHRNVYEWKTGHDYLISSGTGSEDAFFLDNSESGEDVFFATSDNLVAADTDGAYDVYDARMGVPATPSAPACTDTGCQGLPAAAPSFATPSSATFTGVGNYNATPGASTKPRPLTRAQLLAKALKACHAHPRAKRRACEAQARRRYGPRHANKSDRRAHAGAKK